MDLTILDKRRSLLFVAFWLLFAMPLSLLAQEGREIQPEAKQLMQLANQARAAAGKPPLHWDEALAEAALKHTLRMVAEEQIAHRYGGEQGLSERAAAAGAHFDLIEENVAIGPDPATIHDEWMHSTGHRENLLNPQVNRVGIALVASRGVLYATADYAHGVQALSTSEVEARVADLIRPSGVTILANPAVAREACSMDRGVPPSVGGMMPGFVMRWQDADVSRLPKDLIDHLASGQYRKAAVGSCAPSRVEGDFTVYRVAVLLY